MDFRDGHRRRPSGLGGTHVPWRLLAEQARVHFRFPTRNGRATTSTPTEACVSKRRGKTSPRRPIFLIQTIPFRPLGALFRARARFSSPAPTINPNERTSTARSRPISRFTRDVGTQNAQDPSGGVLLTTEPFRRAGRDRRRSVPKVKLIVSSSAVDTDFTVKLLPSSIHLPRTKSGRVLKIEPHRVSSRAALRLGRAGTRVADTSSEGCLHKIYRRRRGRLRHR